MKTVIWLRTTRVYAQDSDLSTKVERTTVKLEEGNNFKKFIKILPVKGYLKSEPPYIEKVMQKDSSGTFQDINPQPWIDQLNEALKITPEGSEKKDYKHLAEIQAKEIIALKATNQTFEDRLKALEGNPIHRKPKAN